MKDEETRDTRFAVAIVESVPLEHRPAMKLWAEQLLVIQASGMSPFQKAKAAMTATRASRLIWPTIKAIGTNAKRFGWDNRSGPARAFMGVAAVSAAVFGGKAAGIAALGTAVGVPLWVVFGAGAGFATAVVKEIKRKTQPQSDVTYAVINADRRDEV